MQTPAWMNSSFGRAQHAVDDNRLVEAMSLFAQEQYGFAKAALDAAFLGAGHAGATQNASEAIVLYAKCLFHLKDLEGLAALQHSDLTADDELRVVRFVVEGLGLLATEQNLELRERGCLCLGDLRGVPFDTIIADAILLVGKAFNRSGDPEGALYYAEAAYSIFRLFERRHDALMAANYAGIIEMQLSCFDSSLRWFDRALAFGEELGIHRKRAMIRLNKGVVYYKTGRYAAARTNLDESLRIAAEGNWPHRQCFANIALGNVHRLTCEFDKARRHLHTAYNQAQELEYPREEALALEFLGDVYRDEGQPEAARRFYVRAMAIAQRLAPEGDIVMEVHRRVGECLTMDEQPADAIPELERALALARSQGDRFEEGATLRALAEAVDDLGDHAGARHHINASIDTLREIGARHEAAHSLLAAARMALDDADRTAGASVRDNLDQAWSRATAALDLYLQVDVVAHTDRARQLVDRIGKRRAAHERAEARSESGYTPGNVIIHASRAMKDVLQLTDMFAASAEPVLITGETGTGKELIAQRVHDRSARASGRLVTVNVAAIPASVFEREFFGHVRGAFSGADRDQPGFAALADGGTLFLDEIGELPLDMQPKLLRLLQDGSYQAIGDPQARHADVRLVAATNADLARLVAEGRFRADLWYRLRILELHLPPVRERASDVLPLLRHFLSLAAGAITEPATVFDAPSLAAAEAWSWPGNVREIAMVARRALVEQLSRGVVRVELRDGDRRIELNGGAPRPRAAVAAAGGPTDGMPESERIMAALAHCDGNRQDAARMLGLSRSTLYRRMEKLGIDARK